MICYKKADIEVEVFFEDLDAGQAVHHPNYFKICERARNLWLTQMGFDFFSLKSNDYVLAVRAIKSEFLRPISMGKVIVSLTITAISEKTITILHEFYGHPITTPSDSNQRVFWAEVILVSVNLSSRKACPLPITLRGFLSESP